MNAPTQLFPRILSLGAPLAPADHDAWLARDRTSYAALLSLGTALSPSDAMSIIVRLLAVTHAPNGAPISNAIKRTEDPLIAAILPQLPVREVLAGLIELIDRGINNQRASGCIRSYILGSPSLERWAVTHRAQLRRLLTHALGRNTTEACLRALKRSPLERAPHEVTMLSKRLLRFARDRELAEEVFLHLFGRLENPRAPLLVAYRQARVELEQGAGLPFKTLQGLAGTFHPKTRRRTLHALAPSDKLKRDVDAEILGEDQSTIGMIRRWYTGERALEPEIRAALEREAQRLPVWNAHVAVVVDASASMRGIGHRVYNAMAIAVAVAELIWLRAKKAEMIIAGGDVQKGMPFPFPRGSTALAPAIVEAALRQPDCIVVVTDGYENVEQGDVAAVANVLNRLSVPVRVLQVLPAFTERENVTGRSVAPVWPMMQETGSEGFAAMWLRMRAVCAPEVTLRELVEQAAR